MYACDSDDGREFYEIQDLKGKWYLESSTRDGFKICPTEAPVLVIADDKLELPMTDSNGCQAGSLTNEYTFDGEIFTLNFDQLVVVIKVESFSQHKLVLKYSGTTENNQATETYTR
ncbi:hypothetical protein LVD17_25215 [Fulvivirga ulvae]|uniref:hypothetical protein n=1 Tax=Fulvivirga ulvae TaxID=2904245 RepID=UPI001F409359|nr:hypothetical protein [Fulvivirga ulvae]UII31598.1 hypothetical protein LVD17_25215 [Fulvivirga ulvae]